MYNVLIIKGVYEREGFTAGRFCSNGLSLKTIFRFMGAFVARAMDNVVSENQIDLHEEDVEQASRSLKAISHPLRLKILCTLGDREISVQDLVDAVGTSQSNISQHLAIMRDKGILMTRKEANRVFYRVGDMRTLRLINMMREVFCGPSVPKNTPRV